MATAIALKIAPVLDSQESDQVLDNTSASEDEQDSGDEEKHEKLLKEITSLSSSGKKRQKASQQRSEPNKTVSEFHLSAVKDSEQQVELSDLIGSLNKSSEHGNLKKKLDSMQRNSGTLDVPLSKPEAQKIQRTIAYGQTKQDIEKWAPTVKKNREAEHLSFPLKPFEPPRPSLRGLAVNFKPRTPLEEEVAAVLRGSSHVLERSNKELTEEEEKALLAMDLEEAKERRHELQKLRALQSYYETKCRRMKKIKSKKYHRVKRKAEMRAAAKIAAGEDPQNEDAAEALEKADRLRALERVSLKHRNTSKWAKHLMTKAGKNAEAKKLLQEQLRISRTMTEKTVESESDDEMETPAPDKGDDEDKADAYGNLLTSEDNPWKLDTTGSPHLADMSSSLDCDSSTKLHRLQPIRTEEADENGDKDSEHDEDKVESEEEFELQLVQPTEEERKKSKKQRAGESTNKKKKRKSEVTDGEGDVIAKKSKKSGKTKKKNSAESANEHVIAGTDSIEGQESRLLKKKKGKKVNKKKLTDKSKDEVNKDEIERTNSTENTAMDEEEGMVWTSFSVDSKKKGKKMSKKKIKDKSKDEVNKDEIESVNSIENTAMDEAEDMAWTSSSRQKGKKVNKKKLTYKSKDNVNKDEIESVNSIENTAVDETEDFAWTTSSVDNTKNSKESSVTETSISKPKDIRVDPKKIFRIEDQGDGVEEGVSDSLQQKRIDIQQAFANDDVVEEFLQEKNENEEAGKPKDIDLSLPGWGSWAGAGIKPSERKKKKFIKKTDPAPPRKDKDLSHVIINDKKSKLFAKNQVTEVPHPYGNHVQFERSVRNPVGKHWNTGTTVNQLTKPRVSTLIGTIIEPIQATKEIKRSKPEDRKKKNKGQKSSGIEIYS